MPARQLNKPGPVVLLLLALNCLGCPERESTETLPQKQTTPLPRDVKTPTSDAKSPKVPQRRASDAPREGPFSLPPLARAQDLTFEVRNASLWVHSPELGTSLSERAHSIAKTTIEGDAVTIAYEDQLSCTPKKVLRQDIRYFQARLENTRSFRVYEEGRFAEAAQGFRRAMELDEHYAKARTNHIAALARANDLKGARLAFSAALKADPLSTYMKLLQDSDFEPLRAEFRTKNKVAPVLRLVGDSLENYAGYSQQRGLLAVVRQEVSWGAENWTAELHIFDASTRKLVSQHALVGWHDTTEEGRIKPERQKELDARFASINEAFAALEFRPLPEGMRAEFNQLAPAKGAVEASLTALGQKVIAENDVLRLTREGSVLATFHSELKGARPHRVYGVPQLNVLIYSGAFEVAEGCDSGPETLLEVFVTSELGKK